MVAKSKVVIRTDHQHHGHIPDLSNPHIMANGMAWDSPLYMCARKHAANLVPTMPPPLHEEKRAW